jgi:hypothetical protein
MARAIVFGQTWGGGATINFRVCLVGPVVPNEVVVCLTDGREGKKKKQRGER